MSFRISFGDSRWCDNVCSSRTYQYPAKTASAHSQNASQSCCCVACAKMACQVRGSRTTSQGAYSTSYT
ncbi:hypothetical protein, partial [Akkermansia muciniphila]|uniref:hypothetical protein n=1 Tax=Akkermansia muciniphila TaxID=239935 RepID=UPI00319E1C27